MSVYVTGDTHGDIHFNKRGYSKLLEKNLTKNDYVIVAGDFGGIWSGAEDIALLKKYEEFPWTTLFIDGNHENHHLLSSYPVEEWCKGKVHRINNSIIHLMRGQVFEIDGHKFFTMGGAESVDWLLRTEGKSWWANEMPSIEEYEEGFINLDKNNNEVDYILTHTAPDSVLDIIGRGVYSHNKLSNYLEIVRTTVKFDKWFFGHYHDDFWLMSKYRCIFKDVLCLDKK